MLLQLEGLHETRERAFYNFGRDTFYHSTPWREPETRPRQLQQRTISFCNNPPGMSKYYFSRKVCTERTEVPSIIFAVTVCTMT